MTRFIEGVDRNQSTLFPERLEDWIGEDNPVRVIDVFVDELDLGGLGFERVEPRETGRPGYHPSVLLKLYIYGYLYRVQSSRRLEQEAGRNDAGAAWSRAGSRCRRCGGPSPPPRQAEGRPPLSRQPVAVGRCRHYAGPRRGGLLATMAETGARSKAQQRHERIYRVVRQIPAGQAATYGQVAMVAGLPSARMVGRALAALPEKSEVPWHRVINSQGKLAPRSDGKPDPEQRRRLRAEGIHLDRRGRIDFAMVAWTGPTWPFLEAEGYDLEELIVKSRHRRRTGPWCRWRF